MPPAIQQRWWLAGHHTFHDISSCFRLDCSIPSSLRSHFKSSFSLIWLSLRLPQKFIFMVAFWAMIVTQVNCMILLTSVFKAIMLGASHWIAANKLVCFCYQPCCNLLCWHDVSDPSAWIEAPMWVTFLQWFSRLNPYAVLGRCCWIEVLEVLMVLYPWVHYWVTLYLKASTLMNGIIAEFLVSII